MFSEKQRVSEQEVSDPPNDVFTLGYGAHFGHGLFVPAEDSIST